MINLYTSFYIDPNQARQAEVMECLRRNIESKYLDKVILLIDDPNALAEIPQSDKVETILISSRPTYATFFEIINSREANKDWHVIANSDIYFDDTILNLNYYGKAQEVALALTRYDVQKRGVTFYNRTDSQDVWCFHSKVMNCSLADVMLGVPGCDNAIAYSLFKAGYKVHNVSKSIRTYHLHLTGVRNYTHKDKVNQPYKNVPITDDLCLR
jgi:hypothetical protein